MGHLRPDEPLGLVAGEASAEGEPPNLGLGEDPTELVKVTRGKCP